MNLRTLETLAAVGSLTLGLAACGAAVPKELKSARATLQQVSNGPTTANNPAGLHTAKQTLAAAEHSFDVEGDTQETRDLAYTAERRAQTAEVKGRELAWKLERERVQQEVDAAEAARLAATTNELTQAQAKLAQQEQQLANERERRAEAERRAAEAAAALAKFATVKQESRGMVITLSGNVLFETNKAKLFPAAEAKLDDVAKALTQQDPDSPIIVEGHADSQGDDQHNLQLSQERANVVREYLVSKGIAADRIIAKGYGEERPIADNKSPEGRANNRRVEIVVGGPGDLTPVPQGVGDAHSPNQQSTSAQSTSPQPNKQQPTNAQSTNPQSLNAQSSNPQQPPNTGTPRPSTAPDVKPSPGSVH